MESLLTELLVLLVMRTRRPFWRSRPGAGVLGSTLVVVAIALALPYVPPGRLFGFEPMPPVLLATVIGITLAYITATEAVKHWFFRRHT